jgi:predicted acylesterase/phospholipase RssA
VSLRLVDGGVFDNQGISALIDHECDAVLVSDGSRQIEFESAPGALLWKTLGRTNDNRRSSKGPLRK